MSPKGGLRAVAITHHTFQFILNLGCDSIAGGTLGACTSAPGAIWYTGICRAPASWVQKWKVSSILVEKLEEPDKLKCPVLPLV